MLRAILRPKWIPTPGWQYVDPEKEIKSIVRAIRAGLISRSKAVAQYGFDAEELDREIAADNRRAQELGLVFDSDPSSDRDGAARASAVGDAGNAGEAGEAGNAEPASEDVA